MVLQSSKAPGPHYQGQALLNLLRKRRPAMYGSRQVDRRGRKSAGIYPHKAANQGASPQAIIGHVQKQEDIPAGSDLETGDHVWIDELLDTPGGIVWYIQGA